MGIIQSVFLFLRAFIRGRAAAAVENLALRMARSCRFLKLAACIIGTRERLEATGEELSRMPRRACGLR